MMRKRNPSGDDVTAHELALYAVNNAELYRSRIVPVIANLQRKIKRGVYDPALAPKIWRYVADDAAKRYLREFGGAATGYDYFTVPIRKRAAEEIAAHYSAELRQKNPAQRIRSTRRRPKLGERRLRGRARMTMGGEVSGAVDYFFVQVKRGAKWITLAGFPRGEFGKARATEYGKLLARRYPRQQFRVFWPDALRKNPAAPATAKYHTCQECDANFRLIGGKFPLHKFLGKTCPGSGTEPSKKNPAPRAVRADGAEVQRAARLFTAFTGHRVTKMRHVPLPQVKVGLAIGPVLELAYTTTRDGKRENYLHKFRHGARPLLAASQDGRTLLLLGGAHRFTPRGIVDTPPR